MLVAMTLDADEGQQLGPFWAYCAPFWPWPMFEVPPHGLCNEPAV